MPVNGTSQVEEDAKRLERDNKISELFECWDSDLSGVIDIGFIECTLSLYKPTPLADVIAQGK